MNEQWNCGLDGLVAGILERANTSGPPIDVVGLAERLQNRVVINPVQNGRASRRDSPGGSSTIILAPDERNERMYFAAAHEIGEQFVATLCERVGELDADDLDDSAREDLANHIAARLLCPNPWFRERAEASGFDLFELKAAFVNASHEVIARRMLDFEVPTVITIFDNGDLWTRMTNFAAAAIFVPVEREVLARCRAEREPVCVEQEGIRVQAWPIDEDGWKREILRTTRTTEF